MKNIFVSMPIVLAAASTSAQDVQKAITKEAVRLFADKDDAMSVIMIVPKGSVVEILSLDSLYFKVSFEGTEGFVKSDGLDLDSEVVETSVENVPAVVPQPQAEQPVERKGSSSHRRRSAGGSGRCDLDQTPGSEIQQSTQGETPVS